MKILSIIYNNKNNHDYGGASKKTINQKITRNKL